MQSRSSCPNVYHGGDNDKQCIECLQNAMVMYILLDNVATVLCVHLFKLMSVYAIYVLPMYLSPCLQAKPRAPSLGLLHSYGTNQL